MIIGLGAVGGYALEGIARAGVGRLILVDFDTFDETNINRQILALSSTVGRKKVEVARERVLEINPDCQVETRDMFVDGGNLPELLAEPVDFVVDAIDSLSAKCALLEELTRRNISFMSSQGAALRTDTACIKTGTLDTTRNCGLARQLRQRLRRRGVDVSRIKCVYSDEPPDPNRQNAILKNESPNGRDTLGSLPTITAIFGLIIANEVIKTLAEKHKD